MYEEAQPIHHLKVHIEVCSKQRSNILLQSITSHKINPEPSNIDKRPQYRKPTQTKPNIPINQLTKTKPNSTTHLKYWQYY